MKGKKTLWATLLISLIGHLAWQPIVDNYGVHIWHPLNALFIFLLCVTVFRNFQNFITFVLMCFAGNNLADELFFDPATLGLNEICVAILAPISWMFVKERKKNVRERA